MKSALLLSSAAVEGNASAVDRQIFPAKRFSTGG